MIEQTVEREEKKIQYEKKGFPEPSDKVDDLIVALVALDGRIKLFDNWIDEKFPVDSEKTPAEQQERLVELAKALDGLNCKEIMTELQEAYQAIDQLPKHIRK